MTAVQILILVVSAIVIAVICTVIQKLIGVEDPLIVTGAVTGALSAMIATKYMKKNKGNN